MPKISALPASSVPVSASLAAVVVAGVTSKVPLSTLPVSTPQAAADAVVLVSAATDATTKSDAAQAAAIAAAASDATSKANAAQAAAIAASQPASANLTALSSYTPTTLPVSTAQAAADAAVAAASIPLVQKGASGGVALADLSNANAQAVIAQAALARAAVDLAAGTATTIAFWGDSTFAGFAGANPTPVATAQATLRSYYNNTAATCANHGTSGYGTTDVIATWAATMAAETASVVVCNYAINDFQGATSPAITAAQFEANVRSMATTARLAGKLIVWITPVPAFAFPSGGSNLGTQTKAEGIRQFADIIRKVGTQMGFVVWDLYAHFERVFSRGENPVLLSADGLHPSVQTGYDAMGRFIAYQLMASGAVVVDGLRYIPAIDPCVRAYNGSNLVLGSGARTNLGRIARNMRFAVDVSVPGMDIYLQYAIWQSGSSAVAVKVDNATVATISMQNTTLGTGDFVVDAAACILENARPGVHFIELDAPSADAALYGIRAHPTRVLTTLAGFTSPATVAPVARFGLPVLKDCAITAASASGEQSIETGIPLSWLLTAQSVEMMATLPKGTGIIIGARRTSGSNAPRGGMVFYLDASTGFLTGAEGTVAGYDGTVAIGAADLSGAGHIYRFDIATTGVVTCYVDGASIGTFTPARPWKGGTIGFYLVATNSLYVKELSIAAGTSFPALAGAAVGEYIESLIGSGSAVALTTATSANVTSYPLTAGDWDVEANVNYTLTGATVTQKTASVGTTSATLAADGTESYSAAPSVISSVSDSVKVNSRRVSLASTTTVYLVARATFSAGTVSAYGLISARRVR